MCTGCRTLDPIIIRVDLCWSGAPPTVDAVNNSISQLGEYCQGEG